ncbi:hypothetical protein DFH11DRAFT_1548470 [Phellopilus nigrolimitatus]|nr:hypothetical protein DFH11DRAFT_1548470 [Phellopilus nigrolimitatus]
MHSIRSDVEPVDPSLVPLFISEIGITKYTGAAISALLVYNTIITMDKEIKYFWLPLVNCYNTWFQNRYIGILGAISGIVYFLLIVLKGLGFIWIRDLADILLLRVQALYHQKTDKRLPACLRALFGLEAAFGLGILIYGNIYQEIVVAELAKGVTVCGESRSSPKVWAALSWVAPILYAVILMVLALYKAAEHWRETAGFGQFTLVKVLIQDQAVYFIIVMEIISGQLDIPNPLLSNLLGILGSPSLMCVLGSHLLVHLKEAGERGANGGTSYKLKTISSIGFS